MTEQAMEDKVKEDGVHVYSAEWCSPCKMLKAQLKDKVDYNYVDVEEHSELAAKKDIRGVPYIEIMKGGELLKKFTGATDYKEIIEMGRTL